MYVSDYRLTTNEEYNSDKNFPGWHVLSNENRSYLNHLMYCPARAVQLKFDYCLVKCSSPNPVFIHEIEDAYCILANPIKIEKICFKSYELKIRTKGEVHEYFNEYFKQNNAEYLIS